MFPGAYDLEALNWNQFFCMLQHGLFIDEANVLFWKVIAPKAIHKIAVFPSQAHDDFLEAVRSLLWS